MSCLVLSCCLQAAMVRSGSALRRWARSHGCHAVTHASTGSTCLLTVATNSSVRNWLMPSKKQKALVKSRQLNWLLLCDFDTVLSLPWLVVSDNCAAVLPELTVGGHVLFRALPNTRLVFVSAWNSLWNSLFKFSQIVCSDQIQIAESYASTVY